MFNSIPFDRIPVPDALKPFAPLLYSASYALVIVMVGWLVSKWVNGLTLKGLRKAKVDESLTRFLASIAQYLVLAAAVITALGKVGIETTSLVAILASAGLAIGLALQGSLANFASGVMLLLFRPFTLTDKVTLGGHTGVVEDIGLFATTIITIGNEVVIVPNSAITSNTIVNFTAQGTLRGGVEVGVAYGSKIEEVMALLEKTAKATEFVMEEPAPAVIFTGLGASSLDLKVVASATTADYYPMLGKLFIAVYNALNEAGIDIPFNQIVVHQAET